MPGRNPYSKVNRHITKAILEHPRASSREIAKLCGEEYTRSFPVTVSNLKKALRKIPDGIPADAGTVSVEQLIAARDYVSKFGGDWLAAVSAIHTLRDFQVPSSQ